MKLSVANAAILLSEGHRLMQEGYHDRSFCDDLFVFDGKGEILFSRRGFDTCAGTLFYDRLGAEEQRFLVDSLFDGKRAPLLLGNGSRACLVIRSLYPATGLFVAFLLEDFERELVALAEQGSLGSVSLMPTCRAGELSAEIEEERFVRLRDFWQSYHACFGNRYYEEPTSLSYARAADMAAYRLTELAVLCGCRIRFEQPSMLPLAERFLGFDKEALDAITLCLMLTMRELSLTREIAWSFRSSDEGLCLCARAVLVAERRDRTEVCLAACRTIADRLRILFAYDIDEKTGAYTVTFCPIARDWSLLGIKSGVKFEI